MSLTILANNGDTIPLFIQLDDGETGKFPDAEIRDEATGALITNVTLAHIDNGLYMATYTVPSADKFLVRYTVYEELAHTTVSPDFTRETDLIIADFTPPATVVAPLVAAPC